MDLSALSLYRKELPKVIGSDEYPLPRKRVFGPIEETLIKVLKWNPFIAVDAACTAKNKVYARGLTKSGISFPDNIRINKKIDPRASSLEQPWHYISKNIWCSTPYSENKIWSNKARIESDFGSIIVALYSYSRSKPANWIQNILRDYYYFNLGRLRVDYWARPDFDNMLVIYGIKQHNELLDKYLSEFKNNIENRINICTIAKKLGEPVQTIIEICNKIDLRALCRRKIINDGRNSVLKIEYENEIIPEYKKLQEKRKKTFGRFFK